MPSFLITKSMSPALAARVAASVSGRRSTTPQARRTRPLTAIVRFVALALVVASVSTGYHYRRRTAHELAESRKVLLQAIDAHASSLSQAERNVLTRVEAAITLHVKVAYEGDFIAEDLRSESALNTALRAPTLYVRGPLENLLRSGSLAKLALNSGKDAFVLCLLDPPDARTEKALGAKARAAAAAGPSLQVATHIERLGPLFLGLPFLAPPWIGRVNRAEDATTLQALRRQFEAAPVKAAVRAAKAGQLLTLVDEAGTGTIELDGERPHGVRVILTELGTGKLRIRFRREVDPAWISDAVRAEYAAGIDSCGLAMDLRNAAAKPGAVMASDRESGARKR